MGNNNNNNKMSREQKEAIFRKYQEKSAKQILKNDGEKCKFGNESFIVKALEWDDSTEFEKTIKEIFVKIDGFKNLDRGMDINKVTDSMFNLLNEDLLALVGKATSGKITLEYIREKHATKKDVINIIIAAIGENFGAIKNLMAQRPL